jgi:asparaginyl-tRNA synthetase
MGELEHKYGVFAQVHPPVITSSDCEGAGEVFNVVSKEPAPPAEGSERDHSTSKPAPFFRTPKYLTVSSQLHLEAYAAVLGHVWALSPTFRAEKSDTPRHLAEFYMLEVEVSYETSLRGLTGLVEHTIRSITAQVVRESLYTQLLLASPGNTQAESGEGPDRIRERWVAIGGRRWKHASYTYCMNKLREAAAENPSLFEKQPEWATGLQIEHERWIVEHIGKKTPIFVTHYPKSIKPFYMPPSSVATDHPSNQYFHPAKGFIEYFDESEKSGNLDTVACFDLLMPFGGVEIAGGSLREPRLENLIQNMRDAGMLKPKQSSTDAANLSNQEIDDGTRGATDLYPFLQAGESLGSLRWYADLRRYGTMPHGGFGIGFDRLIAYLCNVHNLRDVVGFPRSFGRADC